MLFRNTLKSCLRHVDPGAPMCVFRMEYCFRGAMGRARIKEFVSTFDWHHLSFLVLSNDGEASSGVFDLTERKNPRASGARESLSDSFCGGRAQKQCTSEPDRLVPPQIFEVVKPIARHRWTFCPT